MRKVIVNSTPLIVLCGIGQLFVLRELYQEIWIPEAVYREVTAKEDLACVQVKTAGAWLHVERIRDYTEKKMYKAKLHDGEVEVMIFAQEQEAGLVILDDNAAKRTAKGERHKGGNLSPLLSNIMLNELDKRGLRCIVD